jgi:hypothetical protein
MKQPDKRTVSAKEVFPQKTAFKCGQLVVDGVVMCPQGTVERIAMYACILWLGKRIAMLAP